MREQIADLQTMFAALEAAEAATEVAFALMIPALGASEPCGRRQPSKDPYAAFEVPESSRANSPIKVDLEPDSKLFELESNINEQPASLRLEQEVPYAIRTGNQ
jgi:hypothetical protein